jgi:uncharacterized protein
MTISVQGGRVLGCLVEKEFTTPQQYPLTLNALSSACNQTTNRQPVMVLDDPTVERALDELKASGLVRFVLPSHGKSVTRFRQVFDQAYGLDAQRAALLATLLLRGPQTAGELRARAERMAEFDSIGAVQHELEALASPPEPLVRLLQRRPGQKEERWQQLLAVEPNASDPSTGGHTVGSGELDAEPAPPLLRQPEDRGPAAGPSDRTDPTLLADRVDALETRLTELQEAVSALSDSVGRLRRGLGDEDPDLDQHPERDTL